MAGCLDETKHRTNVLRQHDVLKEPVNSVAMFEAVSSKIMAHPGIPPASPRDRSALGGTLCFPWGRRLVVFSSWRDGGRRSPELLAFLSAVIPSHVGGRHIPDTAYTACDADVRILQ
jgi:hypothetical protein